MSSEKFSARRGTELEEERSEIDMEAEERLVAEVWANAELPVVDLLGVGVAQRHVDGRILRANPPAFSLLGLTQTKEGDIQVDPSVVLLRDDGSAWPVDEEPFAKAISLKENQGPIRIGLRKEKNVIVWGMHQVSLVYHPRSQELLGAVHCVLDVSAWKDSADALRRSQDLLRKAQEIARVGSWDWDLVNETVIWTEETHRIFGIPEAAFDGRPASALSTIHPEDREALLKVTRRSISDLTREPFELRVLRDGGEVREVWLEGETIFGDNGAPIRIFGAVQDVTERRRAEREHRSLEEQLRQAQKMDSVGQLAGGVAHDFNNLLQVILGNAELGLGVKQDVGRLHSILEEIKLGAERAAELTQQLLVFSRRQVIRPVILDLNELLSRLVKMLNRLLGEEVELKLSIADSAICVNADPGALEQVVVNLVLNARDAISQRGQGSGVIHVEIETALIQEIPAGQSWAAPGSYAVLRVRDNGCGIQPEIQEHIFEPFFTTKQPGEGTGLGLSVVYGIVRQHIGLVTVESDPSWGTSFEVSLPLSLEVPEAPSSDKFKIIPGGNELILVVEDEPMVRELAFNLLTQVGYRVLVAEDGEQALKVFQERATEIDLVLLDVVMPKLGGHEVRDQVRIIRPDTKILFTSGYDLGAKGVFTPEPGEHVIPKPYRAPELLKRIRELIDSPRLG